MKIDFETIAKHIISLVQAGKHHGVKISKIIFVTQLQKYLFATEVGKTLAGNVAFSTKPLWVRHNDHYHTDFEIEE